jgi:hypothetical protein
MRIPESVLEKVSDRMRVRLRTEIERRPMQNFPFSARGTNQ